VFSLQGKDASKPAVYDTPHITHSYVNSYVFRHPGVILRE